MKQEEMANHRPLNRFITLVTFSDTTYSFLMFWFMHLEHPSPRGVFLKLQMTITKLAQDFYKEYIDIIVQITNQKM